jgi:hypothetical protein
LNGSGRRGYPAFFGYLLRAGAVLIPLFLLLTLLPIAPVLRLH